MYKNFRIYSADLGRATGIGEMKARPVVVIGGDKDTYQCLPITSRSRDDMHHVRMDNYIIYGYCDIDKMVTIKKKYLKGYIRDCTIGEQENIRNKRRRNMSTRKVSSLD